MKNDQANEEKSLKATFSWMSELGQVLAEFIVELVSESVIAANKDEFARTVRFEGGRLVDNEFTMNIKTLPPEIQVEVNNLIGHVIHYDDYAKAGALLYIDPPEKRTQGVKEQINAIKEQIEENRKRPADGTFESL